MFGRNKKKQEVAGGAGRELPFPPVAADDPSAVEVLRVWAAPNQPQQVVLRSVWGDPGAWGLLLVDIARHAARAYSADGAHTEEDVLARIRELFDTEWQLPTDEGEGGLVQDDQPES